MKKFFVPALAVAVSVFSAFATKPTTDLFVFSGNSAVASDRVNPNNYSIPSTPPSGCSGSEVVLCSIEAVDNGAGKPMITSGSSLHTALQNGGRTNPDFTPADVTGKP
jgi:hypothetical protein